MKEWTFRLLPQLPHPPEQLIKKIDTSFRPSQDHFSAESLSHVSIRQVCDWKDQSYEWIQPMASNKNKRRHFDPEFLQWVRENITHEFQESNSGFMLFDEVQLPHTDLTRDYVLLYNLNPGGKNATLCFWQEEGKELYRERMVTSERGQHLKLIDSITGPFNCWYLMNTRILHSVENVEGLRLNLQISFDKELPQSFFKGVL